MSRAFFVVTYDTVTPESAEDGDVAERGYASPGGWKHNDRAILTLKEAISACGLYAGRYLAGSFEDGGRAFYTISADQNYRDGSETNYTIHPPATITRASYRRLRRLLVGR